ncbi:MAG: type II toxin-antitoxin system RatA family toxin [Parvularculaceae bacterium]
MATRRTFRRRVRHDANAMFDLVADVERYPSFLPWCRALRVVDRKDEGPVETIVADMVVAYRMFRESFRSRSRLDRDGLAIDTGFVRGPLKQLQTAWRFRPVDGEGCEVCFEADFEFKNPLLQRVAGVAVENVFGRMGEAFVERADALYGTGR